MLDSYQDLIDGLTETPTMLRDMLGAPVPDDVSPEVRALLAELCSREKVEVRRVQAVMRERQARLRPIGYEPEMRAFDAVEGSPEELLSRFNHDRSELVSLLVNLTLSDWDRAVDHEELGEITIADEIDDHLTWDEGMIEKFETAVEA
jgi:hypothetical protein